MIQRHGKINAMRRKLAAGLALLAVALAVLAGPFVTSLGKAATPTQCVITFKTIEFRAQRRQLLHLLLRLADYGHRVGGGCAGGVGGSVGSGQSLPAGRHDAIRVTFSRDFSITASATSVGTGNANCGTGSSAADVSLERGYTVQVVKRSGGAVITTSDTLSVPSEANTAIGNVSGMAVVGSAFENIRVTNVISAFTVLATDTVPPAFTVQFDVTNAVEFLDVSNTCHAIILPPTVTYITPTGTTTFTGPL